MTSRPVDPCDGACNTGVGLFEFSQRDEVDSIVAREQVLDDAGQMAAGSGVDEGCPAASSDDDGQNVMKLVAELVDNVRDVLQSHVTEVQLIEAAIHRRPMFDVVVAEDQDGAGRIESELTKGVVAVTGC